MIYLIKYFLTFHQIDNQGLPHNLNRFPKRICMKTPFKYLSKDESPRDRDRDRDRDSRRERDRDSRDYRDRDRDRKEVLYN